MIAYRFVRYLGAHLKLKWCLLFIKVLHMILLSALLNKRRIISSLIDYCWRHKKEIKDWKDRRKWGGRGVRVVVVEEEAAIVCFLGL